jgi:flavin reductase (DIM6/NTAB) family NADH-FMN oxidoreductase RutF
MTDKLAAGSDRYRVAREVLSLIPCPVVLIAGAHGERRSCSTGTAMYVSFSPASLAIAQHPGSRTTALIEASGEFSISVLTEDQLDVAVRAGHSAPGDDKFKALGLAVTAPPDGLVVPGVADSIAVIWCRVTSSQAVGDHMLFTGEVVHAETPSSRPALLRHRRRYARVGEWLSEEAPEGYPT